MSFVGHLFELFAYDMGPVGWALLVLLALGAMWLGYRFSRPSDNQLSIRQWNTPPNSQSAIEGHVTKQSEAYLLLALFSSLLVVALWCSWQVRTGFPSYAPAQYLEIERHLRAFAWTLLAFSAVGLSFAVAIVRRRRWGYRALAILFSMAAIIAAVIRAVMPPRVVVDPDWPLVLAIGVFAVFCWHRSTSG